MNSFVSKQTEQKAKIVEKLTKAKNLLDDEENMKIEKVEYPGKEDLLRKEDEKVRKH